jgi:hypothetical protein
MGHFLSSTFFDVALLLSYFLPILFSFFVRPEGRFFVPTCRARVTPRAAAVKDGRRRADGTNSVVDRPRLDGGEHGVTLHLVGTANIVLARGSGGLRPSIRGEPAVGEVNVASQPCIR